MQDISGTHLALMGINLIAGTMIGWMARSLSGAKSQSSDAGDPKTHHPTSSATVLANLSQSTAESSKEIRALETRLDQHPDGPDDVLVSEIRKFGSSYSEELHLEVSTLASLTDRKDTVIRQVIAGMIRHSDHVHQFNQSVSVEVDRSLPENVKALFGTALAELLTCNQHLESELNTARRELEQQRDELANARRDARIDPLTKIANRRSFEESHRATHSKFERCGETYAIVMFDLDHFKSINDAHGHGTGDIVLQVFAKVLQDAVRKYDVAARWGGEEFVLLLANTSQKDCMMIAERVRRQTSAKSVRVSDGTSIGFMVSGGVALVTADDAPVELIKRADAALYQAKHGGRNRVQFGFADDSSAEEQAPQPAAAHS